MGFERYAQKVLKLDICAMLTLLARPGASQAEGGPVGLVENSLTMEFPVRLSPTQFARYFAIGALAMTIAQPVSAFDLTPPSKSFEEEHSVASQQHEQVVAQFGGLYENPELAAYVDAVGQRVAAASDMPDKPFTFTVLNSPVVNAFTVGGGYVYVTRGILASINSEAELAGLLGHEIGHVTARHTARRETRMEQDRAAAIGVGLLTGRLSAALLADGIGKVNRQAYSRGQEADSDTLGIESMDRAGYDPYAMPEMLKALKREVALMNKMAGNSEERGSGVPEWLSDHPETDKRVAKTEQEARATGKKPEHGDVNRDAHLDAIDGILFGEDPRLGVLENGAFKHPEYRITFDIPAGYQVQSAGGALLAVRDRNSVVLFTGAQWPEERPLEEFALSAWYSITDGDAGDLDTLDQMQVNGLNAVLVTKRVESMLVDATLASVAYRTDDQTVFSLSFLIKGDLDRVLFDEFREIADSFRPLSEEEVNAIPIPVIEVATVAEGDSLASLGERMLDKTFGLDRFKALNAVETLPAVGTRVKLVVDGQDGGR